MEYIINVSQFENMIDNKIIGIPKLIDTEINFRGKNNILVCDNNIKLENIVLDFNGDNSIVYLRSDLKDDFKLVIYNNSTIYIGKNNLFKSSISINVYESKNLIIGDNCLFEKDVTISTADYFPIFNEISKDRINFSSSVYIGDHVWVGCDVNVSKGVKIGSGAIIGPRSFIPSYSIIPSNSYLSGNPVKIINKNVFFTMEFLGPLRSIDSLDSNQYNSDIFIYTISDQETLSMDNIDKILFDLDIDSRLDFIQKLFVMNKRKNRFAL